MTSADDVEEQVKRCVHHRGPIWASQIAADLCYWKRDAVINAVWKLVDEGKLRWGANGMISSKESK